MSCAYFGMHAALFSDESEHDVVLCIIIIKVPYGDFKLFYMYSVTSL